MISHQELHLKHQLVPGIDFDSVHISSLCTVWDVFTQFCLISRYFHFFLRFWSIFYALENFLVNEKFSRLWLGLPPVPGGGKGAAPQQTQRPSASPAVAIMRPSATAAAATALLSPALLRCVLKKSEILHTVGEGN